jgi:hyperosmotically inducible protein
MKALSYAVKALLIIALLVLAGSTIGTLNANAAKAPRTVSSYESWLNQQVHHKLTMLPWYGVFDNLQYRINGSDVILEGQVVTDVTKADAEAAVKSIEGVTRVVNNIQVLPLSPFDDQIRSAEYRAIYSQPQLSRYAMGVVPQIHIIVNGGHVTLEGVVATEADRDVAGLAANRVPGVFSVTNNLRVD